MSHYLLLPYMLAAVCSSVYNVTQMDPNTLWHVFLGRRHQTKARQS